MPLEVENCLLCVSLHALKYNVYSGNKLFALQG